MKKAIYIIIISYIISAVFTEAASGYWVWTPETKKFINPKYAVKDSPEEQFKWAMDFYNSKDYQRAAVEFQKLTRYYEYSEYAPKAQYHVGLSYEKMGKFYIAFQNYQKTVDNYPHIENIEEIIEKEYEIGNLYLSKANPKLLGVDILTSLDRAVEIYKKVTENAPYGKLADQAQFKMGEALKRSERYEDAVLAFQKILEDYPQSKLLERAKYEVAYCAYKASLKPEYASESTDKAIRAFEEFVEKNKASEFAGEAADTMQRLKDNAAEKPFLIAKFYERQRHYKSAILYYREVIQKFPDSSFAKEARLKIEELQAREAKR